MKSIAMALAMSLIGFSAQADYAECTADAESNGYWGVEALEAHTLARLKTCEANGYWEQVRLFQLDRAFQAECAVSDLN